MKKWFLLILAPLIMIGLLLSPLMGSGGLEQAWPRKEIRDREGRILFKIEKRYRLYYLGELPLPEALRPLLRQRGSLNGSPPYLLAENLSGEEARRYADMAGVVLEDYLAPQLIAGPSFASLLRALPRDNLSRRGQVQLTLAWEIQDSLYRLLRNAFEGSGRISAGVVDLASGEVYALVSFPENEPSLLLEGLYPLGKDLPRSGVFGEKTGIELPESPGVYWPSGEILATPLQMARALANQLCGWAPRIHLIKKTSLPTLCRPQRKMAKKSYIYNNGRSWLRLSLWPEENPRFVLILAGESTRIPPKKAYAGLFQALARWLPEGDRPMDRGKGFPDLRGLTLRAALERLPREGLRIEFEGVGRVVKQWPLPGTPWKKVKSCKLYLRDAT